MEKKIKFSDKPLTTRIIYAVVVAILCLTAIIIGIVAAANRVNDTPDDTPPADNIPGDTGNEGGGSGDETPDETPKPKPLAFVSPIVGTVVKDHDLTTPVFSETLGEWRVHAGIDISAEEGANVYASETGTVSGIYKDPKLGYTVEITHEGGIVTRYSNLAASGDEFKVGDTVKSGEVIGTVGDSTTSELADEPHLHFELLVNGKKMHPLDYITKESQKASLGIE
ncbi:MAG: M23 family metallopeptidase [Clostridia bacterium]|nr:M23 family metallopeptidase [Clostridia bacterium]